MARPKPRRGRSGGGNRGLVQFLAAQQRQGRSQRSALAQWRARGHSIRDASFREAWRTTGRQLPEQRLHRGRRPPERAFQRVRVAEGPTRYVYHVGVLVRSPRLGVAWQLVQVTSSYRITPRKAEDIAAKILERTARYRVSVLDTRLDFVTKEVSR